VSRNPLLLALALTVTVVVTGAGVFVAGRHPRAEVRDAPAPSLEAAAVQAAAGPRPVELLHAWDARRARAWSRGDPRLLRALYTPGSVAGRRDRAMLRAWAARGLVVRQLRTQLLSVRELARSRSSWTLAVTDRLVGGEAVGAGVRRALPQDRATTRTVRLRRWAGAWRVAAVLPGEVRP
jgi:hypothetical protein